MRIELGRREPPIEHLAAHHALLDERPCERLILFLAGRIFRNRQVVNFETPTSHESRVLSAHQ